jgi:ethanolamine ammonia-lyase small subunit
MNDPDDLWALLKSYTPARLGLGRVGASLPTKPWLAFGVAHAAARDAVHALTDWQALEDDLKGAGFSDVLRVKSAATGRGVYLRRPDLGRTLAPEGIEALRAASASRDAASIVWMLGDGLSAAALQNHAVPLLAAVQATRPDLAGGPIVLAANARVALGDEVGALFGAEFVVVAIGERPGLSSPDSLGLYLTRAPKPGRVDSERNCLSNVRPAGMSYRVAAAKLCALIDGARALGATGTRLKDDTDQEGRLLLAPAPAALSRVKP